MASPIFLKGRCVKMNNFCVGDWVLVIETGQKLQIVAMVGGTGSISETRTSYITSDGVRRKAKEIEKYVDMSDDFDNMITIVLEHKQLDRMINLKLDNGDYDNLDDLVRNKKQLEKKYEDCIKK